MARWTQATLLCRGCKSTRTCKSGGVVVRLGVLVGAREGVYGVGVIIVIEAKLAPPSSDAVGVIHGAHEGVRRSRFAATVTRAHRRR